MLVDTQKGRKGLATDLLYSYSTGVESPLLQIVIGDDTWGDTILNLNSSCN
jgi:hypothetical protein